jgi:hypothetical protein
MLEGRKLRHMTWTVLCYYKDHSRFCAEPRLKGFFCLMWKEQGPLQRLVAKMKEDDMKYFANSKFLYKRKVLSLCP